MDKERISQLMARKLSGEAAPEEIQELEAHLQEHPEDGYFLSILDEYWTAPVATMAGGEADADAHFRHILEAADRDEPEQAPRHRTRYLRTVLSSAAVLAVLLCCGWLYRMYFRAQPPAANLSMAEITAKPGAKSRLLLSDGTVVWLNSGSRISYPESFTDSLREVELEGEAYFDVAAQAGRPFIVHTRDLHIRVLGTAFNVKCYPNDHQTEATLVRGLIQVTQSGDNTQPPVLLHPREKIVVDRIKTENVSIRHIKESIGDTAMVETAWVYNKLVFDGEDFSEIASEMERWFNVKITINDPAVARYRFHAGFDNEQITEVLAALQLSSPFTFKITNNEVNIYK